MTLAVIYSPISHDPEDLARSRGLPGHLDGGRVEVPHTAARRVKRYDHQRVHYHPLTLHRQCVPRLPDVSSAHEWPEDVHAGRIGQLSLEGRDPRPESFGRGADLRRRDDSIRKVHG